jgi:predicted membrane chloride channel (bestrophin family)
MVEAPVTKRISPAMEQKAIQRAKDRAKAGMWGLDIAVFLFAVLIIVIVLLFQDMGIEVVAPIAIFGLAMVWFLGWRRGRKLYQRFYDEEIAELRQELRKAVKGTVEETIEDTIEERVQRALRKRWE